MRQRIFVVLAALAVLVAACGGDNVPGGGNTPSATEKTDAVSTVTGSGTSVVVGQGTASDGGAPGQAVTLQFLTIDDKDQLLAFEEMTRMFQKSNPKYANVQIKFRAVPFEQLFPTIEQAVATKAELDLFLADAPDLKHYAFSKAIVPLQSYYTPEEIKQFVPESITEGSYKGEFLAPPIMQSCSLLFYNKEFTDPAGVKPPEQLQGWTIEEAKDAWKKTTQDKNGDGNPDVWGVRWGQGTYQGDYEHGILRRSAGKKGSPTFQGVSEDGLKFQGYMDTPEAIKAFEEYRSWHQGEDAVTPREPIPEIFFARKSAFYLSPDNAIGTIKRQYPKGDFKYGVTGIPYFKDGAQLCHTGSWHFGVSPQTKNQEIAAAVAKFFAGPEASKVWYEKVRQLPARLDLLNTLPEYNNNPQGLFKEGLLKIGVPRIQTPGYTEYQQVFGEMMKDIAEVPGINVQDRVKDAAVEIEGLLQKYEGWNK